MNYILRYKEIGTFNEEPSELVFKANDWDDAVSKMYIALDLIQGVRRQNIRAILSLEVEHDD